MIVPTIGRVVHYRPSSYDKAAGMDIYDDKTPLTANIVYVWSDTCINLVVFDHGGHSFARTSVPINETSGASAWAEWMDFQKGQAAKTEAAEAALKAATG